MSKPLFKASEGDGINILRVWEEVTESGLYQVSGTQVLIRLKVRPEAFPSGLPISVFWRFLQRQGRAAIGEGKTFLRYTQSIPLFYFVAFDDDAGPSLKEFNPTPRKSHPFS
jgi:hypothetical protein